MIQHKKAQIRMMETISVLLVFMILLTFIVLFYITVARGTSETSADEESDLRAVQVAQLIGTLPEFQCSFNNIINENCFDVLKMESFISYTNESGPYEDGITALSRDYFDLFTYSHITVTQVYPYSNTPWVIYSREPSLDRFESRTIFTPISIYYPQDNLYTFGILNVTVYS